MYDEDQIFIDSLNDIQLKQLQHLVGNRGHWTMYDALGCDIDHRTYKKIKTELAEIYNIINNVIDNNDLTWEQKYDMIFSDDISKKVHKLIHLEYYDPDSDYKDDVLAFVNAFNDYYLQFYNN